MKLRKDFKTRYSHAKLTWNNLKIEKQCWTENLLWVILRCLLCLWKISNNKWFNLEQSRGPRATNKNPQKIVLLSNHIKDVFLKKKCK